jgi:hypothetical protein
MRRAGFGSGEAGKGDGGPRNTRMTRKGAGKLEGGERRGGGAHGIHGRHGKNSEWRNSEAGKSERGRWPAKHANDAKGVGRKGGEDAEDAEGWGLGGLGVRQSGLTADAGALGQETGAAGVASELAPTAEAQASSGGAWPGEAGAVRRARSSGRLGLF